MREVLRIPALLVALHAVSIRATSNAVSSTAVRFLSPAEEPSNVLYDTRIKTKAISGTSVAQETESPQEAAMDEYQREVEAARNKLERSTSMLKKDEGSQPILGAIGVTHNTRGGSPPGGVTVITGVMHTKTPLSESDKEELSSRKEAEGYTAPAELPDVKPCCCPVTDLGVTKWVNRMADEPVGFSQCADWAEHWNSRAKHATEQRCVDGLCGEKGTQLPDDFDTEYHRFESDEFETICLVHRCPDHRSEKRKGVPPEFNCKGRLDCDDKCCVGGGGTLLKREEQIPGVLTSCAAHQCPLDRLLKREGLALDYSCNGKPDCDDKCCIASPAQPAERPGSVLSKKATEQKAGNALFPAGSAGAVSYLDLDQDLGSETAESLQKDAKFVRGIKVSIINGFKNVIRTPEYSRKQFVLPREQDIVILRMTVGQSPTSGLQQSTHQKADRSIDSWSRLNIPYMVRCRSEALAQPIADMMLSDGSRHVFVSHFTSMFEYLAEREKKMRPLVSVEQVKEVDIADPDTALTVLRQHSVNPQAVDSVVAQEGSSGIQIRMSDLASPSAPVSALKVASPVATITAATVPQHSGPSVQVKAVDGIGAQGGSSGIQVGMSDLASPTAPVTVTIVPSQSQMPVVRQPPSSSDVSLVLVQLVDAFRTQRSLDSVQDSLVTVFQYYDTDRSGSLSQTEIAPIFADVGLPNFQNTEKMVQSADVDGNLVISFTEFSSLMVNICVTVTNDSANGGAAEQVFLLSSMTIETNGWSKVEDSELNLKDGLKESFAKSIAIAWKGLKTMEEHSGTQWEPPDDEDVAVGVMTSIPSRDLDGRSDRVRQAAEEQEYVSAASLHQRASSVTVGSHLVSGSANFSDPANSATPAKSYDELYDNSRKMFGAEEEEEKPPAGPPFDDLSFVKLTVPYIASAKDMPTAQYMHKVLVPENDRFTFGERFKVAFVDMEEKRTSIRPKVEVSPSAEAQVLQKAEAKQWFTDQGLPLPRFVNDGTLGYQDRTQTFVMTHIETPTGVLPAPIVTVVP